MIERKFVANNIKEFLIKEFVSTKLGKVGLSDVKLQRTPLGEKIIISTSRPGLVVGRSGTNITQLTKDLKKNFDLENPQIEIEEIKEIHLDANIIAEFIAGSLERFGSARFKGVGHKAMSGIMGAGALGVEILISGKIPSSRAKSWRFYMGYLKKCGDISIVGVKKAYTVAKLKTGIVGIKVSLMLPDVKLPDKIDLLDEKEEIIEELSREESKVVEKELEAALDQPITDADKTKEEPKTKKENKDDKTSKKKTSTKTKSKIKKDSKNITEKKK
ncbi:MAG: 30S ribosomal protein S3 [Nanoarchaeota archaeon]|nr:30S ribosomal protein S3 [Nanoarchaeota archaeon]MBU1030512.1 30S ribosomal protein S3 [Nanoarchaeota archaeon]MBU1850476.1 30S ribosomal protein S3 [Nanoarchaeota archaeon]